MVKPLLTSRAHHAGTTVPRRCNRHVLAAAFLGGFAASLARQNYVGRVWRDAISTHPLLPPAQPENLAWAEERAGMWCASILPLCLWAVGVDKLGSFTGRRDYGAGGPATLWEGYLSADSLKRAGDFTPFLHHAHTCRRLAAYLPPSTCTFSGHFMPRHTTHPPHTHTHPPAYTPHHHHAHAAPARGTRAHALYLRAYTTRAYAYTARSARCHTTYLLDGGILPHHLPPTYLLTACPPLPLPCCNTRFAFCMQHLPAAAGRVVWTL